MEALILVDLDNLLGGWQKEHAGSLPVASPRRGPSWLCADDPQREHDPLVAAGERPDTVVVVAANSTTMAAAHRGSASVDLSYLHRLAASLGALLTPGRRVALETGLTLQVPDGADNLLERLLEEAPRPEHAGQLERVALISQDMGLMGRVRGLLGRPRQDQPWFGVHRFWHDHANQRTFRDYKTPAPAPPGEAQPPKPSRSTRVRTAAEARAVGDWPLDLALGADLPDLARRIEANPSILTQIGATERSLRGLDRLARIDADELTTTGPCAAADGLEFHRPGHHQPGTVGFVQFEPSPVGAGAVHLQRHGATVRCDAPYKVLIEALYQNQRRGGTGQGVQLPSAILTAAQSRLDLETLLRALEPDLPFGTLGQFSFHKLQLRIRQGRLEGSFDPSGPPGKRGWWVLYSPRRGYHASSRAQVGVGESILPYPRGLTVDADLMRRDHHIGRRMPELVAVSAAWRADAPSVEATLGHQVAAGTIGQARAGYHQAAVLAPSAPLPPGPIHCVPIQLARPHDYFHGRRDPLVRSWFFLQRLPLLVPLPAPSCPAEADATVQGADDAPRP